MPDPISAPDRHGFSKRPTPFKRGTAKKFAGNRHLGRSGRQCHISGIMDLDFLLSFKILLVGSVLAVFFVYERLRPAADSPLLLRLGRATRILKAVSNSSSRRSKPTE